ncbi:hypothetical protein M427DRAFT_175743 [Gonapodya prolifera JEL478]|uniref:Uncharacterized protein n=1 Tax=Gonapodya prolifera (strain JEL478) TaxID=1344416 RepID=A0A139B0R2_GONPJ|nr:hypothetical protein M427DRAFT_175743 [Gonapodya prolifera JEL478]|eukprot:KXS22586.1 hypothetical protein M427DRAFT_175743 [Gonapodya prolifera JEL478]
MKFVIEAKALAHDPAHAISANEDGAGAGLAIQHRVLVAQRIVGHCEGVVRNIKGGPFAAFDTLTPPDRLRVIVRAAWEGIDLRPFLAGELGMTLLALVHHADPKVVLSKFSKALSKRKTGTFPDEDALTKTMYESGRQLWNLVVGYVLKLESAGVLSMADAVEVVYKTFWRANDKAISKRSSTDEMQQQFRDLRDEESSRLKLIEKMVEGERFLLPSILLRITDNPTNRYSTAQCLEAIGRTSGAAWMLSVIEETVEAEHEMETRSSSTDPFSVTDASTATHLLALIGRRTLGETLNDAILSIYQLVNKLDSWDWSSETPKHLHRKKKNPQPIGTVYSVLKNGLEELLKRVAGCVEDLNPFLKYLMCTIRDTFSPITAARFFIAHLVVPQLRELAHEAESSISNVALNDFSETLAAVAVGVVNVSDLEVLTDGSSFAQASQMRSQMERLVKHLQKHVEKIASTLENIERFRSLAGVLEAPALENLEEGSSSRGEPLESLRRDALSELKRYTLGKKDDILAALTKRSKMETGASRVRSKMELFVTYILTQRK